ncbi:hypothetical protein PPERSA_04499 [Pseudocohnilembus persalinus]|uniref:Uncharacterized protein n=1 Tax=Pseudocohnilembus persalinus TaxID=266149 RepID=A0A0V0QTE2_PSEPJ|nr:hypothetical protein PPERSA_04499 [Pseudocohnilembus persalinus]|eukprot:KRX05462.1 hypothetical protein PPERSA_04499 [Pseudocohnilembus persalinus]
MKTKKIKKFKKFKKINKIKKTKKLVIKACENYNYNQEGDLIQNENEEEFEYYDEDQNKINPFQVDQEIQEGIDFPVSLVNQQSLEGFMAIMENLAELQMIFKSDFKEICSFYSLEELYKFIEGDYDFSEEEEQQFKGEEEQKFAINRLFGYLDALENQLEMDENEGNYVRKIEFLEKEIAVYKEENQKVNEKLRELKELYEGKEGKKLGEEFFNSQLRQSEIQFENLNGLRKQSKENVQQEFQLANQINQSQINEFGGGFEAKNLLENSKLSGVDKSSIDFGYNTEIQQLNLAQQSYINNNNQQNSGLDQLEIINNLEKQKQELLKSKEKKTSGEENEQGENDMQVQIVEDKEMNQNFEDLQENQQPNFTQNKREKSYSSSIIEDLSFLQRQQKKFSYQENQNQNQIQNSNQNQNQDNQKNRNFLNVPGQNQLNYKSEIRQVGSFDSGINNNKIYSVLNSNNKRKNSEQVKNLKKMNLDKRGLLRFQTVIEKKKSNKGGEIKPLDEDKLEKLQKIVEKQKTMQVNNRDLEQIFKEIKEEENQKKQLPKSKTVMFQTEIGFSSKQDNNLFDKKTKSQLKSNPLSGKFGKINFQAQSKEEKKQNLEKILKKQVKKYQYLDKKDYYYLKNNLGFQKLCYKLGTDYKPLFSDRGYVFDPYQKQTKKSECVILINSREIFFIHHKYLKLQEKLPRISMRTVAGVIFNDFCSSLTILKVIKSDSKNEFDYYFLENFKRYEMISFLATIYKKSQKMQLPIMQGKFEQVREILGKGHVKVRQNRGKILREQICANSCFNTSKNLGFLQLKQDSFFRSNKWVDVFVVLNEQGFVCYRCGENEQYIFPINSKSYLCKNLIIMKNCKAFSFLVSDDLKQKKQLYNVDQSQNNQKKFNLDFNTNENKNLGKIEENQEEEDESSGEDQSQSQNKNESESENENQREKSTNCTLKTGDSNDLKGVIFSAYSQCNLDFVTRIIEKFLDSRMNLEQNLLNHEIKRISNVECNLNYV